MVCIKCGQELAEGAKFCTKCGFSVNTKNAPPGKLLLKITGILLIISGIFGIASLIGTKIINISFGNLVELPDLAVVLSAINGTLSIILGILGVMYSQNIGKAKLLKYGIFIYIAFNIVQVITGIAYNINVGNFGLSQDIPVIAEIFITCIGSLIGLIVPVLFLLGAQKNLKAKVE